jgi:hypothetical protein
MSAAFDTVDHLILLDILENRIGLRGQVLRFFSTFLHNRPNRVRVGSNVSEALFRACGVPQGSLLGPILFTIYMLPLCDLLTRLGLNYHFYADDSQIYMIVESSFNAACDRVQSVAFQIVELCNSLKVNEDKTEIILFNAKRCQRKPVDTIQILGKDLPLKDKIKTLGVTLDCNMTMRQQINSVCSSCFYVLRQIGFIRRFLNYTTTRQLVQSLVISRLDYCNSLYADIPCFLIGKLQRVMNRSVRLIFKLPIITPMTHYLHDLHMLPVKWRIMYKILTMVFLFMHINSCPQYLGQLLRHKQTGRTRASREPYTLDVTRHRKAWTNGALHVCGPKLWNSLPLHLRLPQSTSTFRKKLKTHLFRLAFY